MLIFAGIAVVVLVIYFIISFFWGVVKDSNELRETTAKDKFSVIVDTLNKEAFDGLGNVTVVTTSDFNIHKDGQNQIIKFYYGGGSLTVQWKYKFLQKETICEKKIRNARNLSIVEQREFAQNMAKEMTKKMAQLQEVFFN